MIREEAKIKIVIDYEDDGEATAKGIEKLIDEIYDDFDNIFGELMDKTTVMAEGLVELNGRTCLNCRYFREVGRCGNKNSPCNDRLVLTMFSCSEWEAK